MAYLTVDYQLAANNNNAAGLTLVTAITDGTHTFAEPLGLSRISRGQRMTLANGTVSRRGSPRLQWQSSMTVKQYWHLVNTYEGPVTIRTPYGGITWANYNAVLTLPDPEDLNYVVFAASDHAASFIGPGFLNVLWTFTRVTAI